MISNEAAVKAACDRIAAFGGETSLFIDADKSQIDAAVRCGAPAIEIHTGAYADAENIEQQQKELQKLEEGIAYAIEQGLVVNAGHGLHYHNVEPIARIPGLNELNIGHAIIARAVFTGLKDAVKEMRDLIEKARQH